MPYPSRLVPKSTDRFDTYPDPQGILCRWTDPTLELTDQEGKLSAEAVDEKRIINYSVNKLPPSFIEDIYIEFYDKEKFNQEWRPGTDGYLPNDEEYRQDLSRGVFFFRISDIEYEGTYPYPANLGEHNYKFRVRVRHVPLISNIAHYELNVFFLNLDGTITTNIPGKSSASRRIIAAEVRQKLVKIAKFALEDF